MTTPSDDRQHEQQPERGDQHRPAEERHPAHAHAGARVVSTVVASETAAAARPTTSSTRTARNRSTIFGRRRRGHRWRRATRSRARSRRARPRTRPREPRERERAGAELQRHDGDARPSSSGSEHDEDEPDPVRDEQLGEGVGVEQRVGAVDALEAEQHADDGGGEQRQRAKPPINMPADHLVVGRVNHAATARPAPVRASSCRAGCDVSGLCRWCSSVVRVRAWQRASDRLQRSDPGPAPDRTLPVADHPREPKSYDPAAGEISHRCGRSTSTIEWRANNRVTYVMLNAKTRMPAAGVGCRDERDGGPEEPGAQHHGGRRVDPARDRRPARAPASSRPARPCSRPSGGRPRSSGATAGSIGTSAAR